MRKFNVVLKRQLSVSKGTIIKNLISCFCVFLAVAIVTKKDVCSLFEATKSFAFTYVMASIWTGLFNTLCLFPMEEAHIMPCLKSGQLTVRCYLGVNVVIQMGLTLVQALIGTSIFSGFGYDRAGLICIGNINLDIFITLFLVIFAADALGILMSIFVNGVSSALCIVPVILIAQMLLSKGIFEVTGAAEKICNIIEAQYGIAALGSLLNINELPIAIRLAYPMVEQTNNDLFQHSAAYLWECWVKLGVLAVVPLALSGLILNYKVCKKK